jgi:hypothetical protein
MALEQSGTAKLQFAIILALSVGLAYADQAAPRQDRLEAALKRKALRVGNALSLTMERARLMTPSTRPVGSSILESTQLR